MGSDLRSWLSDTHVGDLDEVPGSWLQSDPAPAIVDTRGVKK